MLVSELINAIYEDNYPHIEFILAMSGGECGCQIHQAVDIIAKYWKADLEEEEVA